MAGCIISPFLPRPVEPSREEGDVASDAVFQAMNFIGFDEESQSNIFKAISAILHAGNMEFGEDKDGNATLPTGSMLAQVANMLSVEEEGIRKSICIKKISAGMRFDSCKLLLTQTMVMLSSR